MRAQRDKKFHFTYQTKNLVNGKTYIGRHHTDNTDDGYLGSGTLLKRAIAKHGRENFVCEPLDFFDSYEEAVKEEEWLVNDEWIKDEMNYNISLGGANPRMFGDKNPFYKHGQSRTRSYRNEMARKRTRKEWKEVECPRCGTTFQQTRKDKKWCSSKCKNNNPHYIKKKDRADAQCASLI